MAFIPLLWYTIIRMNKNVHITPLQLERTESQLSAAWRVCLRQSGICRGKEAGEMRIAVVTGASSGMGREFVRQIDNADHLDEIWVIARRRERLESLQAEVKTPLRIIPMDLAHSESYAQYESYLKKHTPDVTLLVNCAGYGKFGRYDDIPLEEALGMIDVNCKALVAFTQYTLPYMGKGSHVLELDSLSAFQPVPGLGVYGASKAFVLSYSRALGREVRRKGIHVMAVCPGWVKTDFFDRATQSSGSTITYFNRWYTAPQVVETALRDMRKGKDVSICGLPIKAQVLAVKLLPHRLVMNIWMMQQKMK